MNFLGNPRPWVEVTEPAGVTQRDSLVALLCTSVPFGSRTARCLSRSSPRTSTSEGVALLRSQRRSRGFKSHHLHSKKGSSGGNKLQGTNQQPRARARFVREAPRS